MFGFKDLKNTIRVTETTVECPVKGCRVIVQRQRKIFKRQEEFKCPEHNIYISPSTFEYQNEFDNILLKEEADRDLLKRIAKVKRESRIACDNSEDAVTWNVFRFLEKNDLLSGFLSNIISHPVENPEIIYWSHSQSEGDKTSVWAPLQGAREEFETNPKKGSEPDLIIKSKNALFLIECKLTANNNTVLRSNDPMARVKYVNGGGKWFSDMFTSDFDTIVMKDKKYELFRFWLIGSWIAHNHQLNFYLINLVLSQKEKDIEQTFRRHIKENHERKFLRVTWEDVYQFILDSKLRSIERDKIVEYFKNKSIGYKSGKLQKAFSL